MRPTRQLVYNPPPTPHSETLEINRPHDVASVGAPDSHIVALWACPVCETPVPRRHRSGRHRVYCTNSCRQKAYRKRCVSRQARPFTAHLDPRPTRATTRDRVHAVREYRDVLSGRRDSTTRGVTACGAFARMCIDTPKRFGHVRFLANNEIWNTTTCRRCQQLTGVGETEPILLMRDVTDQAGWTIPGGP